jgi:hypothetical protein
MSRVFIKNVNNHMSLGVGAVGPLINGLVVQTLNPVSGL